MENDNIDQILGRVLSLTSCPGRGAIPWGKSSKMEQICVFDWTEGMRAMSFLSVITVSGVELSNIVLITV